MPDARRLAGAELAAALRESRARTWALVADLSDAQWLPARRAGLNPIAWELAHLAWFAEFWVLRGPHGRDADGFATAAGPARFAAPDSRFDSARLAHAARWTEPLPTRAELAGWMAGQLEACLGTIGPAADDDEALYFHRLALFHEDMHGEASCWLRAATGCAAPAGLAPPCVGPAAAVAVPAGEVALGSGAGAAGFAFDNERPGRLLWLPAFEIDSEPVSAGEFARFVDAGGYDDPALWPGQAGTWRSASGLAHPQRWRRAAGARYGRGRHESEWQHRWFDQWLPLAPQTPAIHVNAFEAEAYCRWAGRRLPTAAEWQAAAPRLAWGRSVWEWTADAFAPYPGFAPGPYREYSAPWFGNHRELRGGAFATHARMHDRRYRNFFQPQRTDIFAGFRTAAR